MIRLYECFGCSHTQKPAAQGQVQHNMGLPPQGAHSGHISSRRPYLHTPSPPLSNKAQGREELLLEAEQEGSLSHRNIADFLGVHGLIGSVDHAGGFLHPIKRDLRFGEEFLQLGA